RTVQRHRRDAAVVGPRDRRGGGQCPRGVRTVHVCIYSIAATDFACSRRMNFWILPVDVFGSAVKITLRGTLKRAICARQCSIISASVTLASGLVSTNAHGVSPHFGSGVATTAHASTAGCR